MKNIYSLILLSFLIHPFIGQAQLNEKAELVEQETFKAEGFNYQAIARDSQGNIIKNQRLGILIEVLGGIDASSIELQEEHHVSTNEQGQFNIIIGQGENNKSYGSISDIDWDKGNKWMQVSVDLKDVGNYSFMGKSQLMAVPYALHAKTAESLVESDGARTG